MATMAVRLFEHEAVPGTGSFEVCFADGRTSVYFYFDDLPSRRLRSEQTVREQAPDRATMFARIMRGLIEGNGPRPRRHEPMGPRTLHETMKEAASGRPLTTHQW